jgi:hypothetical protein
VKEIFVELPLQRLAVYVLLSLIWMLFTNRRLEREREMSLASHFEHKEGFKWEVSLIQIDYYTYCNKSEFLCL